MTEAEQNLREIYRKIIGDYADLALVDEIVRDVAIATLKDIRPYLVLAHDTAEARHDDGEGDDYMSGAMYDIMQDTERLIEQIDLLIAVSEE